jgi:asparagine synthase (glutamine-hydrolysing)
LVPSNSLWSKGSGEQMCGIAGLVGPAARSQVDRVEAMLAALAHRGPDDSGLEVFDGAVLGATRLSIIDLEGGHQPLLGPKGRTALVCNGEIYGHQRLRAGFSNFPFRSGSDCEVILPMYQELGEELLPRLPGTFSLALWDESRQSLLAARDRFGERPFYFGITDNGSLAFASESRALLASGLFDPSPDPAMVAQMLRQGYVPSGRSIWQGISCLGHASRLRFAYGRSPVVDRWWTAPSVSRHLTAYEAAEWMAVELDRAVQDQLEADVPVGTFLSGGVDSTTVSLLAARHHRDLHAFTYDMPVDSEVEYARATAARHHITLHEYRPADSELAADLVSLAEVWDEPLGDSSALPTSQLCRFARQTVKVVLTGDGADELLGGYLVWARHCLGELDGGGRLVDPEAGSTIASRYAAFRQDFSADQLAGLGLPALDAADVDVSGYRCGTVDDISRFDLDHYLPGDILVKTDRASMFCGLEVRSPFLDVAVAEGCLGLPPFHKVDRRDEKLLLRRAFGAEWPGVVRDRRKQGFGAPMARWLALPDIHDLKMAHLGDRRSALFDLVDYDAVQPFVADNDQRTWSLLMLSLWWARPKEGSRRP